MSGIKLTDEYEVLTPNGFRRFDGIQKLKKYIYAVSTSNYYTECSYDHPFVISGKIVKYSELKVGGSIETETGLETIVDLSYTGREESVYDLLNVDNGNQFFADGILSHNCQFIETGESAIAGTILNRWRNNRKPPILTLENGHYQIWEEPNERHIYSIGVDVGEGVGEASSVAQVLDITDLTNIRQVACFHDPLIDPHFFAEILFKIANQWGRPYLAIERNNAGGQVLDALYHTHGYNKFLNIRTEGGSDRLGIYSSTKTKYRGVSNMRYWTNTLDVIDINDIGLIQELETFIRRPNSVWKKKDGSGVRDDRVDAFFWALIILETEYCEQYFDIQAYDDRGKPKRIKSPYIESPEFYKLDKMYQTDTKAPYPVLFGFGPDDANNPTPDELRKQGWGLLGGI